MARYGLALHEQAVTIAPLVGRGCERRRDVASVCFYFQVHQPPRLRRYSVFEAGADYLDDAHNRTIMRRVADRCYVPTTRLLTEMVRRHGGEVRLGFSISGSALEQFKQYAPEALEAFQTLAETGCVEFLAETYHHSLAFLYSRDEFAEQVDLHCDVIEEHFGQRPRVFRNTELIYSNDLATFVAGLGGFSGILTEGVDELLDGRSPNHLYEAAGEMPQGAPRPVLLLKNYRLSDDIAFRFSDRSWSGWPLDADKFGSWIDRAGDVCNLFMDYETFGEHHRQENGILQFLDALPAKILSHGNTFATPSELIERFAPVSRYDVPRPISWADTERDLSAWAGNAMQSSALQELYRIESQVKETGDLDLLDDWRRLTTSDHIYYMCTKYFADGQVHKYFNPYASPYDSYINFMNVLDHLRGRAETAPLTPGA